MNQENEKLIDHPDLEIRKPERVTVVGFLAAIGLVVAIVAFTAWLAKVGAR